MSNGRARPPGRGARLMVADSERCADMLYATRFFAPDAFVYLSVGGRSEVLLSDLEIGRGRREARVDRVAAWSDFAGPLREAAGGREPAFAEVVAAYLRARRVRAVEVPEWFPSGLAERLRGFGVRVAVRQGAFLPGREIKSEAEVRAIGAALRIAEAGVGRGIEVLRASRCGRGGELRWGGGRLTSERLRAEVDGAVLRAGGLPAHTIVAGGAQGCDPHERGSGPLKAGELIILDVFPRDAATGYFGDITRTVVRGRATEAQRRMWETVREGQAMAIRAVKPRRDGRRIHEAVKAFFAARGYPTEQRGGRWCGFFHGTGHGLGLEIHEAPRFGATRFRVGQVITVEPGLYFPGVGGVRIEDVIAVGPRGARVLTRCDKVFEL